MTDYLTELRDRFAVAFASANVSPVDVWEHADEAMKRRGECNRCHQPGVIICSKEGCPARKANERIAEYNATERYCAPVFDTKDAREHYPPGDKARLDGFKEEWSLNCYDGFWRVISSEYKTISRGPTIRAAIDDALGKA